MTSGHEIFKKLNSETFPTEAILAARADKRIMIPIFIDAFEEFVAHGREPPDSSLFFAFHLLGEWRVVSAYRTLTKFLRMPGDSLEDVLGDAKTATAHRVIISVFDGDPRPIQEIVFEEAADEFIRSRMIDAIGVLTMNGDLPRAGTEQFLRDCYDRILPRKDCYAWYGWQQTIARLGLSALAPLVEQAFAHEAIDKTWMSFKDFETDLQHAIDHPDAAPLLPDDKMTAFDDTIVELSTWAFDSEADAFQGRSASILDHNPFRKVGRNDPCPCGSGKKFKKCCLNADLAE
jgi:hypothetical protein